MGAKVTSMLVFVIFLAAVHGQYPLEDGTCDNYCPAADLSKFDLKDVRLFNVSFHFISLTNY